MKGLGSSWSSSTRVHSPKEYSHVADSGKSHRRSQRGPRVSTLQHALLGLQSGVYQNPFSPALAPYELLDGRSTVDQPRGVLLPLPKQKQWPTPSTTRLWSHALLARCQSPQCSRSTLTHWTVVEDSGYHLCSVSIPLHLLELCPPGGTGECLENVTVRTGFSMLVFN